MTASDVLFQMPGAVATRDHEGRIVIRSARKLGYALIFLTMAVVLAPFPVGFVALLATEFDKGKDFNPLALVCIGPFFMMVFVLFVLASMATVILAFPRRCEIDLKRRIARFDHVPGFSRTVPLHDMTSVDIILVSDRGGRGCFLGLSRKGSRRLLWIHTFGSRWESLLEVRNRMLPLANFVAGQLSLPIECSCGTMYWLTTVKGGRFDAPSPEVS